MIFSADIEDWQQSVYDFDRDVSKRVVNNTLRLLSILSEHQVKGTFFVQGMVAEKFPKLVYAISQAGHELACHAHTHRPIYTLTPQQFDQELYRSIQAIEQNSGQKVIGFRAPTFSVRGSNVDYYCEALLKHQIRYDSSVMLANVRKVYGGNNKAIVQTIEASGLDCFPMTTTSILGKRIPVMGGGYFRLYPYWLTKLLSRSLDKENSIFYMHPYELDAYEYDTLKEQMPISQKQAWHQFTGRKYTEKKLHRLLKDYPFTSFKQQYYQPTTADKPAAHDPDYTSLQPSL